MAALAARLATQHGAAEVDAIDLKPLDLPLYDGDLEAQGLPPGVVELRARLAASPALFVACPEYNASIPGALKNAIDWTSRPPAQPFLGKVAAIGCVTGGTSGGARVLPDLRKVLAILGVLVLPRQLHVPKGVEAFDDTGDLTDPLLAKMFDAQIADLVRVATRLA